VHQMARAARAGLGGGFAAYVVRRRRRRSQVVERPDESGGFRVAGQADTGIRSRRRKQFRTLPGLVNIVTRHAHDAPLGTQWHILRQPCNLGSRGFAHVRGLHRRGRRSRPVAGFAGLRRNVLPADARPNPAFAPRTVDRVTVDARAFGDKADLLRPVGGSWVVHGILYPQLVSMADAAEIGNRSHKQLRALPFLVDIMARGAQDPSLRIQDHVFGQIVDFRLDGFSHVGRLHLFSRGPSSMARFTRLSRGLPAK